MSRETTSAYDTANDAAHFSEVVFVELQFASGTVRVCSREHNVAWNGQTWLGAAKVGSVEPIEEAGTLEPRGIAMQLAVSPELLALALDPSEYKNRKCRLWRGLLDASSATESTVVADPFVFRMDRLEFQLGEIALLRLTAESRLADWQRPRVRRYNDADQQALYPGDDFFANAEEMVSKELIW